ncbi:hypothetical protein A2Z33_03210 [Candidatus Gottesmanbacteria bacterium RBG_16_52_11]|uniref:N-acetyltransferase domain-containing protein n=1 Tax=Candidatus Gottesmanbacteria bacterium RBG_16_52_11 TaxID=1798374 RepID=A0A1F5YVM2_9BACT|nr:MAG: hypothetical protein A2Z33_03210 [Candidatus Gottesmanbacteria bacterium RBG_16_52_11]
MDIVTRRATVSDLAVIRELNRLLFRESHARKHDDMLDLAWPDDQRGESYYRKALSDPAKAVFLAFYAGKPVGYLIGTSVHRFDYRKSRVGELENMLVLSAFRRRGAGTGLVSVFTGWLKNKGVERVYVSVYAKNLKASGFYRSLGFKPIDVGLEKQI